MTAQNCAFDVTATYPTTSNPPAPLGTVTTDQLGRNYQLVKGGGTVAQYGYVFITSDGLFTASALTTTLVAAGKVAQIGCAQVALTSSLYGWVFRGGGAHTGSFLTLAVLGAPVHPTATAGFVDDTSTTARIDGLFVLATVGGANATAAAWASSQFMFSVGTA